MLKLKVSPRKTIGKKVKNLRKEEIIPAVLYGSKIKPENLQIKSKDFAEIYKKAGESTLIDLSKKDSEKQIPVLIHDLQNDPVTDKIIHIDFLRVDMKKPIKTAVSLEFIGKSKAVAEQEGTLIKNITEIEIQALPLDLPHQIQVDISSLETFEDQIKISDLNIPKKVEILEDLDKIIATVAAPRTQEEMEKLEEKPEQEIPEDAKEEDTAETEQATEQTEQEPKQESDQKQEKTQ